MRKTRSGERVRNLLRTRESLAGCRGAAMTRVFVMLSRARYYKHTSCPSIHRLMPSSAYSPRSCYRCYSGS